MTKLVNPDLIILARESLGITQSELARKVKIDQGNLSKMENGLLSIPDDIIEKIATELSYPITFFKQVTKPYSPNTIHYFRKTKSLPAKELSIIRATATIDRLRVEKLLNQIEFNPEYPSFPLEEYESPDIVASTLRQSWKLSEGIIHNMTELLESKGIIVFPIDFGTRLISDITTDTENGIFIIFLNSAMPPDRKRFTLAHVLGHIVMKNFSNSDPIEQDVDRFASEFLMPANKIRPQLTSLSLAKLSDLKRYWKVSMQAILMRAGQLGTITPQRRVSLWKQLSSRGYRLREPVEISIKNEEPLLLKEIIELYRKELNYTDDDLKDLLFLHNKEYGKYELEVKPKLKLLHFN